MTLIHRLNEWERKHKREIVLFGIVVLLILAGFVSAFGLRSGTAMNVPNHPPIEAK